MGFFNRWFRRGERAQSEDMVWRARNAFEKNRPHAALWFACEALARNPNAKDAKSVFADAFPLASVSLPAIVVENKKVMPRTSELMERGKLNPGEAEFVADAMISIYFAEELTNQIHPLLDRYNTDKGFSTAMNFAKDDLNTVKNMAAVLAGISSPAGPGDGAWRFKAGISQPFAAEMVFAIQVERNALVVVLKANTPRDWPATCQSLSLIFMEATKAKRLSQKTAEDYKLRGEQFKPAPDDGEIDDALFRKYKNGLETSLARNAAHIKWLLSIVREPE
ncbi:MAG: hypothetical protein V2A34_07080 [Lentisphaerota bacterium]